MKAVIQSGNAQFLVEPGQQILVDRLSVSEGKLDINEVLLIIDDNKAIIGQPYVTTASVKAVINGNTQGDKIRVEKFKAKSKYHKVTGSRSKLSKITIESVSLK